MTENCCANCEYWVEKYQKCEHTERVASMADYYDAMPENICVLYERKESVEDE